MSFTISGLSSGIDTTSVINQTLAAASQPQTVLKNQQSALNSRISAYQTINAKLTAVATAAAKISDPATWSATSATSSSPAVAATASSGAVAGTSLTFDVVALARAQLTSVGVTNGTVVSQPSNGIDVVDANGTSHHIQLDSGTPAAVAAAINAAGLPVRASVVQTDNGPLLQMTGTTTGAAAAFSIQGTDQPPHTLVNAADAKLAVTASDGSTGYTVSSATNTFTNVLPGVTFTAASTAQNVTVSLSSDSSTATNAAQGLTDAVNAALQVISADAAKGGVLASDPTLAKVQQQLLRVVSGGAADGSSFATLGVGLDPNGGYTLDATAFAAAMANDPSGTRGRMDGLATSLTSVTDQATDDQSGSITTIITADQGQVSKLTTQISNWDDKLASLKTSLTNKYAAMETALSKLKSESNWLSSMFSSMTGSSSSSNSSGSS